jgi:hypothetical protein
MEPTNTNSNLVGPTVPAGEEEKAKYNYEATFDRPPFVAMSRTVEVLANGKRAKDRKGDIKWQQTVRENSRATIDWVESKNFTEFSPPNKWFEAQLPEKKKALDPRSMTSVAEWTTYTNTKSLLSLTSFEEVIKLIDG